MKCETRNIVSFWELSEAWQKEARDNNNEQAEEIWYIEPRENQTPRKHVLHDLSTCMRVDDPRFDGVIGVSNNAAIGVKLSDCGDTAEITHL